MTRTVRYATPAAGLVALAAAPLVCTPYELGLATVAVATAVLAAGVHVHTNIAGLPTLGAAAPYAAGAYTAALAATSWHTPILMQIALAAAAGLLLAGISSTLVANSRGITTVMITLGTAEIVRTITVRWRQVTGGSDGIGVPRLPWWPAGPVLTDVRAGYTLTALIAVTAIGGLGWWLRSPNGRVLAYIGDNEARTAAAGYNVSAHLRAMHTIAGGIGGLAGALVVTAQRSASPADAGLGVSALVLAAAVIGAPGGLPAVAAAAVGLVAVRDWIGGMLTGSLAGHTGALLGLVFLAAAYLPDHRRRRQHATQQPKDTRTPGEMPTAVAIGEMGHTDAA